MLSLSNTPDARGGGMGDVGAATSPDIYSQYYNPAKYPFVQHDAGISLSYNLYAGMVSPFRFWYLSAYYKLDKKSVLSTSLRYFSFGEIQLFDEYGMLSGILNPFEISFDAALSRKLTPIFSVAAALRLIYSDMGNGFDSYEGSEIYVGKSIAVDLAGYYHKPLSFASGTGSVAAGLNISNIGSKISYDEYLTTNFIPTNMRLGVSFDYPFSDAVSLKLSTDANKLSSV